MDATMQRKKKPATLPEMDVKVVRGGSTKIDIDGVRLDIWVKFVCRFKKEPDSKILSKVLASKKRKIRAYLENELLDMEEGELFTLNPIWTRDKNDGLKYYVTVVIFETDPPPGLTTPPPQPPPQQPPNPL